MPKLNLHICDVCKSEQRQDGKVHWSDRFDGPVKLDLKSLPGVQTEIIYEALCRPCGRAILDAITETVGKRQPSSTA